ncbi:trypsin-like peptidase domain-containing protein [Amnibacterium sp. CER49]|uniref:S1C family serine protease n=1 Tax=Amnibacterium sp. CER49 TaxID=3039161 RepID=UPI00244A4012|nr:trypsin-like peptidase domain-containing protein [Amnibacterium sp. CER49]MDH2445214.1 trypsin-like peptidase domain-containing protein [Amnibacterium sp. CER49]
MSENERSDDVFRVDDEGTATRGDGSTGAAAAPAERAAARPRRTTRLLAFGAAAVLLLGIGATGGAVAATGLGSPHRTTSAFGQGAASGSAGSGTSPGPQGLGGADGPNGTWSSPQQGSGTGSTGTTATAAQTKGVVTIVSTLAYESAESAGTGIVLTASGEILTNNHVVEGATSIRVTDESTGQAYTAKVVGTDATHDIAVLQLQHASGLATATTASTAARVADDVTAVGNAGGTGTLTAATGAVTALKQRITTQAEGSAQSEDLTGLIETDADVVSGDSGGPLENASGAVVGIDTAASSGTSATTGYAIPIASALAIAATIERGTATSDIVIGLPAFLGVSVSPNGTSTSGATIAQVVPGTPAARSGLVAGDTITAVDGTATASAESLTSMLRTHAPGDRVTIAYTDAAGAARTTTVTLTSGPAA